MEANVFIAVLSLAGALLTLRGASCASLYEKAMREPLVRVGQWSFPLTQVMQLSAIIEEEGLDDNSLSTLCHHSNLPQTFHALCQNFPQMSNCVFIKIKDLTSDPYFSLYCFLCQSSACQPCFPSRGGGVPL